MMRYKLFLYLFFLTFLQSGPLCTHVYAKQSPVRVVPEGYTLMSDGVFPIFTKGSNCFLAIAPHLIGREVEIRAQINEGFDMVARPAKSLGVVRIVRHTDDNIGFMRELLDERLLSCQDPDRMRSFLSSNLQSSDKIYKIVDEDPHYGAIIDITEDLVVGEDWYSYKYPHIRQIDPEHSRLIGVNALSDGVRFTVQRRHGYAVDKDKQISYVMILPQGTLPLQVDCMLRLLPERDMPIRLATFRKPKYTISFTDYAQDNYRAVRDSLVVRWDIGSKARQPITFYIHPLFPTYYIPAVRQSIEFWNTEFRKAGLRAPLRLAKADAQTPLSAQRALIAYDLIRPGVETHITCHPRTGEILSCRINVGHGFMGDLLTDYLLTHATVDKAIVKDNQSMRRAVALFKDELTKAIGAALGVREPSDLAWTYRVYPGVKDPYEDRERGLSRYGRQTETLSPLPVSVYAHRLEDLSLVMSRLETITSHKVDRDIERHTSALYTRGYKLYGDYITSLIEALDVYPKSEREAALDLLSRYLFEGEDRMDAPYVRERSTSGLWMTREPILRDVFVHLFRTCQDSKISELSNLIFERVYNDLFIGFDVTRTLTPNQMNIQHLFISTLLAMDDESARLKYHLNALSEALGKSSSGNGDPDTLAYYAYLRTLFK